VARRGVAVGLLRQSLGVRCKSASATVATSSSGDRAGDRASATRSASKSNHTPDAIFAGATTSFTSSVSTVTAETFMLTCFSVLSPCLLRRYSRARSERVSNMQ
jgi:hypothetical protein